MVQIVAGRVQTQDQAGEVIETLKAQSFAEADVARFYVNPQGQHGMSAIGGDHDAADPDAGKVGQSAAIGAATGGIAGIGVAFASAMPLLGAAIGLASGVGAYAGSLLGGLAGAGDGDDAPDVRHAGIVVAIRIDAPGRAIVAADVLRDHGAVDIEVAEGTLVDGDWVDFNPVSTPHILKRA